MAEYPLLRNKTVQGGSGGASSLDDLTDVNTAGKSDGDILIFDSASGDWLAGEQETTEPAFNWAHANLGNDFTNAPVTGGINSIAIGEFAQTTAGTTNAIALGTQSIAAVAGSLIISTKGTSYSTSATDKLIILTDDAGLRVQNDGTFEVTSDGGSNWSQIQTGILEAPNDGESYVRESEGWVLETKGLGEAPNDGSAYVRESEGWVLETKGLGEAPEDTTPYVRQDAGWISMPDTGIEDAPEDGIPYSRQDAGWVASPSLNVQVPGSLAVGKTAYFDGTTSPTSWQLAQANSDETLGTHIVVSQSGGNMTVQQSGFAEGVFSGLVPGTYYYVSAILAGELTDVEPTAPNWSNPILLATATDSGWVLPFRASSADNVLARREQMWANVAGLDTFSFDNNSKALDIYLNGAKLIPTEDYTTTETSFTLENPVDSENDVIYAVSYPTIGITDVYSTSEVEEVVDAARQNINLLINGRMVIAQRGHSNTTGEGINGYLGADRWSFAITADIRTSDGRAGSLADTGQNVSNYKGGGYLYFFAPNTFSVGTTSYLFIKQAIEGHNACQLEWGTPNAKPATISFNAQSLLPGTFAVGVRTVEAAYVIPFTCVGGEVTEHFSFTIPGPTIGTWGEGISSWGDVFFSASVGSDFWVAQTETWEATGKFGFDGITNLGDNAGDIVRISQVQFEEGEVETPFEMIEVGNELATCQRYFEKSTSWIDGNFQQGWASPVGMVMHSNARFAVVKRTVPTVTLTHSSAVGFPAVSGTSNATIYGYSEARASTATGNALFGSSFEADAEL